MIRFKTMSGAAVQVRTSAVEPGTIEVLRLMPKKGDRADNLVIQAGTLKDGYLSSVDERSRMRMKLNLSVNAETYYSRCAFLTEGLVQMDNNFLVSYPAIMAEKKPMWQLNGLRVRPDGIEFLYRHLESGIYHEVFLDDRQFDARIEMEYAREEVATLRMFWQRLKVPVVGEVTGYCVERPASSIARDGGWWSFYVCAPVTNPEEFYIRVTHTANKTKVGDELKVILRSDDNGYHYYGF